MTQRQLSCAALLLAGCTTGVIGPRGDSVLTHTPIAISELHTTSGELETVDRQHARIRAPSVRTELARTGPVGIELTFIYEGETKQTVPLASGEQRTQLGLKLLSFDSCNVTYVMWRMKPQATLQVSQKRNPGQTRHEQCSDAGYHTVPASWQTNQLPPVLPGQEHKLSAQIIREQLEVKVDDQPAWRGNLPRSDSSTQAHVGLRADNAAFQFSLSAIEAAGQQLIR
jgi:hypothetical protein